MDLGKVKFLPFMHFQIVPTTRRQFEDLKITNRITNFDEYWTHLSIDPVKFRKYGKFVGLFNRTEGGQSVYYEVPYDTCTKKQLENVHIHKLHDDFLCPDFSKVPE